MSIAPGRYTLGPQSGELLVHTGRKGGAKKAGHDLVIEVKSWNATMDVADDPAGEGQPVAWRRHILPEPQV